MKHDFNRKNYSRQVTTNNLIGILLSLGAIAMAIILYILATALKAHA